MSRKRVLVLAVVVAALGILAVFVTPLVLAGGGQEDDIREAVAAFEEAYLAGDVERVMALYADDAVSMPPGYPASVGKAAIRSDFEGFFGAFDVEARDLEIVDIWVSGNRAARRGVWSQTLNDGSGSFTEFGKCIVGFEKFGNEWKISYEIWNYHPEP